MDEIEESNEEILIIISDGSFYFVTQVHCDLK